MGQQHEQIMLKRPVVNVRTDSRLHLLDLNLSDHALLTGAKDGVESDDSDLQTFRQHSGGEVSRE
jgi:hypothetical protein